VSLEPVAEILGESPVIVELREQVRQLRRAWSSSRRPPPVLIQGETGTGKGLLARTLHRASPRATQPLVELNCAAVPETLLEAELFGYERGAFTDARQAKPGLLQITHRGTLFLDEIALLTPPMQAKLLSVIEDRAARRLGAVRTEPVDVWVVAATNEDLPAAIQAGAFREGLLRRELPAVGGHQARVRSR
jgi:two-component system, NtrC family, response regulator AtoC